jgi:hypothetical protein
MGSGRFAGGSARPDYLPFRGWERIELVGLIAAVSGLGRLVEDVEEYALDALEAAGAKFRRWGGADPRGLTMDEAGAICLYTKANLGRPEQSMYAVLNRACHSDDRRTLVPFFKYLKLFFTGARKLPNACPIQVWRAFPNRPQDWETVYAIGNELHWWGFTSTTKDNKVLQTPTFFGTEGNTRTLFSLDCINGIDISAYSDYAEAEVLLLPGAKFVVTQRMSPEMLGGAAMIVMKQLPSRHDILTFTDEPAPPPAPAPAPAPPPAPVTPAPAPGARASGDSTTTAAGTHASSASTIHGSPCKVSSPMPQMPAAAAAAPSAPTSESLQCPPQAAASALMQDLQNMSVKEIKAAITSQSGQPTCGNGHRLVRNLEDNGWACDGRDLPGGCKRGCTGFRQSAGWGRYRCATCDYDLCDRCYEARRSVDFSHCVEKGARDGTVRAGSAWLCPMSKTECASV